MEKRRKCTVNRVGKNQYWIDKGFFKEKSPRWSKEFKTRKEAMEECKKYLGGNN